MPSEQRKPLWLIPNLLSLDAPLVAVAWLYIFAKTWRVDYLPWPAYFALGLVVWVIYVTDRLLDFTLDGGASRKLEPRHQFHYQHRRIFKRLVVLAAIVALGIVVTRLPFAIYGIVLGPNGYMGYAIIGALMVAGFFILSVFTDKGPDEIPYGKNILAGISFAYGTSMIAFAYTSFDFWDFIGSRQLICFAVLCILNISAIDFWEHASRSTDPEANATDELALTLPLILLGGAALFFAAQDHEMTTRPFFYAILTGAALLHILNRNRARFSMDAQRVLADAALLVPFVVFLASEQS